MIILGIDPGLATTGYGVVEKIGSKYKLIDYGVLLTSSKEKFPKRLGSLSRQLKQLISYYSPKMACVEELFFSTNIKTAISVAQARGVIVCALEEHKIDVEGYTPLQVKSSVCGYGKAEKHQVQYMVQKLLNLKEKPKPDDAADALAIAICHGNSFKLKSLI